MTNLSHVLKRHGYAIVTVFLVSLALLLMVVRLDSTPPLWWNEGWNLTVARTWVEQGYYGLLLEGEPASPGLSNGLNVVAPAAASFRLLGIGTWQGRLPFVLISFATLWLTFYLARSLFNRPIAVGTLVVLFFMSTNVWLHPAAMGRLVLGEMLALFFLLGGYACLLASANGKTVLLLPAVICWSLALTTKAQVLPFWTLSLIVPMVMAGLQRHWRTATFLVVSLVSSMIMARIVLWLHNDLVLSQSMASEPMVGLYQVTALVLVLPTRLTALFSVFTFGILSVLGLLYAVLQTARNLPQLAWPHGRDITRLAILVLSCSWLAWYVLLSVGWLRYLFPATYLASMFVAAWLYELSHGYSFSATAVQIGSLVRHLRVNRRSIAALVAFVLVILSMQANFRVLYQTFFITPDKSVRETADYLNTQTPSDVLIESYESELFVFLDRPYHFPPNPLQIPLTRRSFLRQDISIDYDPLASDADYLVSGPSDALVQLYTETIEAGSFKKLKTFGWYTIYQRQRE